MSKIVSGPFGARILATKADGIVELSVWDYDLTPLEPGKRSTREWAEEHIRDTSALEHLESIFGIPEDWDAYEIVFTARIDGSFDSYSGEYDEELNISSDRMQKYPMELVEELYLAVD